jgi:hypothetical protein
MLASIGWAVMGVQPNAQICVNVKVHQEAQEPMLEVLLKEGPCLLSYFCCCAFRKSPYLCYRCVYFFRITQYIGDTHNARPLIPMNTHTQILSLGASSKTVPANPQD